jgi:hypothetical protein
MQKLVSMLITAALLAACAATPFQPSNANGYGYVEQQVAADVYTVVFVANTATSMQQVHDYALLRAAEIGAAQGYRYLTVEQDKSGGIMLAPYRPGGSAYGMADDSAARQPGHDMGMMGMSGGYGNSSGASGGTYSMGSPSPGSSPARACALKLHYSKQADGKQPQDIQALLTALRARYGIPAGDSRQ